MSSSSKTTASTSTLILATAFATVFLLTALMGVWAAYDRSLAWRAFGLIVLGLALAVAVVWIGRRGGTWALGLMSVALALLAGAIGVYFLLILRLDCRRSEICPAAGHRPLGAGEPAGDCTAGGHQRQRGGQRADLHPFPRPGWTAMGHQRTLGTAAVVGRPGLVGRPGRGRFSRPRVGAWLGVGAGLLAMGYLLLRRRLDRQRIPRLVLDLLAIAAILSVVAAFWIVVRSPGAAEVLGTVPVGGSAFSRATLWRDGLDLVRDYPFTGSGLRSTMMVYSTYGMLIHVGFISHMHNLLLQIAVEQGVIASLAFVGLLAVAAASILGATRPGRRTWRFGLAAGAVLWPPSSCTA